MLRLAWAALAILLPAVGWAAEKARRQASGPNILLITIDTLRADHLSCYGYSRLTSPHIDRLAQQGVRFRSAYSPIPLTGPAHSSLLTSVYPQQHGATINGMKISAKPRPVTLAQLLHRNGYRTAAFVSAWPLKKGIAGLGRGFDVYNDKFTYHYKLVNSARRADEVTAAALAWLQKPRKRPFFLWVHFFDPHSPYEVHSGFTDLASNPDAFGEIRMDGQSDPEVAQRVFAYDSEIAFTDHQVGKLVHALEALHLREKTLLVLTADHGENLGENGYVGHGDRIDQPIVHIPLIFSFPGVIPAGKVPKVDASLVDVMPTLLEYAGIPVQIPIEGRSLKSPIDSGPAEPGMRHAYFLTYSEPPLLPPNWVSWLWTWAKTKMVPSRLGFAEGQLKFVLEGDERQPHVFHLDATARVETPREEPELKITAYQTRLTEWLDRTNRGLPAQGGLSQEDIEMLRSLGYIN
jgi:arylsulfatase A-like enzyme